MILVKQLDSILKENELLIKVYIKIHKTFHWWNYSKTGFLFFFLFFIIVFRWNIISTSSENPICSISNACCVAIY